jgi:hypothetical protein
MSSFGSGQPKTWFAKNVVGLNLTPEPVSTSEIWHPNPNPSDFGCPSSFVNRHFLSGFWRVFPGFMFFWVFFQVSQELNKSRNFSFWVCFKFFFKFREHLQVKNETQTRFYLGRVRIQPMGVKMNPVLHPSDPKHAVTQNPNPHCHLYSIVHTVFVIHWGHDQQSKATINAELIAKGPEMQILSHCLTCSDSRGIFVQGNDTVKISCTFPWVMRHCQIGTVVLR